MQSISPVMVGRRRAAVVESLLLRVDAGFTPRRGWRDRCNCIGLPVNWWFDGHPHAAQLCRTCPVRLDCLASTLHIEQTLPDIDYAVGLHAIDPADRRAWLTTHRPATIEPPRNCGTESGYYWHRANGQPTCVDCRAAHARAAVDRKRARRRRRIAVGA